MDPVITAAMVAIVTGVITGALSSLSTISSLRVHIDYIRQSLDRHDSRLMEVEKEQHRLAGAVRAKMAHPSTQQVNEA